MRAGKYVWCGGLVAIRGFRTMKLQHICLRTWYHSIRHVSFENQREKLLDRCPSIRHANLNCETLVGKTIATLSMQDTCLLVQWDSIAMSLQLQQICILAWCNFQKHHCCSNMPTGCVMCKIGACWTVATQSICLLIFYHSISMPADLLPLIHVCLLVLCISICHTCLYGVSLSAVPAGVESHYSPCLLVWCLIISHALRCVVSPKATPSGVVPHYQPCPLVWCLTVGHVCW